MSWHSGDWANFSIAFTSAIASVSAAIAAFKSKITSEEALKYQKGAIKSESMRNLRASIKKNAKDANNAIGNLASKDWINNHISMIANAACSAKDDILAEAENYTDSEVEDFKKLFLNQLSEKIVWEMHSRAEPLGIEKQVNGDVMALVFLKSKWSECRDFFKMKDDSLI